MAWFHKRYFSHQLLSLKSLTWYFIQISQDQWVNAIDFDDAQMWSRDVSLLWISVAATYYLYDINGDYVKINQSHDRSFGTQNIAYNP